MKARIDSKNGLEGYLYNLKNTLEDDEKGLSDKLSEEDKEELDNTINEALDWLDENPEAEAEEFEGEHNNDICPGAVHLQYNQPRAFGHHC